MAFETFRRLHHPVIVALFSVLIASALLTAQQSHAASGANALAAWLELGPDGVAIARVITTDSNCPAMTVDSQRQPMQVRATPSADYPVLVCEAAIVAGAHTASVEGRPLPVPKAQPQRIVVLGDTGCRLLNGRDQACNDARAWPAAAIATSAAAEGPDLVVHIGDYYYRENPCTDSNPGCAGSPSGDNWASWNADFFAPEAPLLAAAPWVVTRGNHELCSRGGNGWFRFLDPRPLPATCQDYTDPYAVLAGIGDLKLLVFDSASADDANAVPDEVAAYVPQFNALWSMAGSDAWLITHRPLWGVGLTGTTAGAEQTFVDNATLEAASNNTLPPGVELVLGGHIHLFETLSFPDGRPPQILVGTGGDLLDTAVTEPLAGLTVAGDTIARGSTFSQYGYMTLTPSVEGWSAAMHSLAQCSIQSLDVTCFP